MEPKELFYRKLLHRTLWALGISGVANIFLFAFLVKELDNANLSFSNAEDQVTSGVPYLSQPIQQALQKYQALDFDQLITLLDDEAMVSDGYSARDCALSVLVTRHHFYIEKALVYAPIQKRSVSCNEELFFIFPGLTSAQYCKIGDFIKHELYPFTFQGLFLKLKAAPEEPLLQQAFKQNPEYKKIEQLLLSDAKLSESQVFTLVCQANWTDLTDLCKTPFPMGRKLFLEKLMAVCPKEASHALLDVEYMYALHSLDDKTVLMILEHLPLDSKWSKEYALKLFLGPRQNLVRKQAALTLCKLANLEPEKQTRESLLKHYGIIQPKQKTQASTPTLKASPAPKPIEKQVVKPVAPVKQQVPAVQKKPQETIHVVLAGESLWSIARRYKVDIAAIKKRNNLQSDALRPGTTLYIPKK